MAIKRVAVIGAGASGLTAIKEFLRAGFEVVAYEARSQVGGAWIQSSSPPSECIVSFDTAGRPFAQSKREKLAAALLCKTKKDTAGNGKAAQQDGDDADAWPMALEPSPMYALRTNIPCDLMSYRGAPFTGTSGPFPRDDEVLQYLRDYAREVEQHIRFERIVKRVYKRDQRWVLESADASACFHPLGKGKQRDGSHAPAAGKVAKDGDVEVFDAVCDCSGHYSRPYIPFVKGLWQYKRQILHAKWYRSPDTFEGKNVLVVGNSASGYDVSREIATHFRQLESDKRVYQSVRHPTEIGIDPSENPAWTSHLSAVAPISHATPDRIVLTDGRELDVDITIFATGYLYSFPYYKSSDAPFRTHPLTKTPPLPDTYVSPELGNGDDEYPDGGLQVHNLDADYQTFYQLDPTLAFLCLNKSVIPFPLAQAQAHAVAKYWSGHLFPLRPQTQLSENPLLHKYGSPKEFDVADALLRACGEGREPAKDVHDDEILPDGSFPATSVWRREKRPQCKAYRKQELGY